MHFVNLLYTTEIILLINLVSCAGPKRQGGESNPVTPENATAEETNTEASANEPADDEYSEGSQETAGTQEPLDYYSFVALIDIVFQDGSKRTCSGAIIHDNAVITAAHCFNLGYQNEVQVEMTASFVVIGTKLMFESGYEQYLPIEKILTHPNYTGWTADLALVFTYAGLASDKPGRMIPLAGERGQTPVDSNVTVLSWGKCHDPVDSDEKIGRNGKIKKSLRMTAMPPGSYEKVKHKKSKKRKESDDWYISNENRHSSLRTSNAKKKRHELVQLMDNDDSSDKQPHNPSKHRFHVEPRNLDGAKRDKFIKHDGKGGSAKKQTTKNVYLDDALDDVIKARLVGKGNKKPLRLAAEKESKANRAKLLDYQSEPDINMQSRPEPVTIGWARRKRSHQHSNSNWRRHMAPHNNNLTVEVFNFVNSVACMKLVDKSMPAFFSIKNKNEVLCYTSEEHYITFEDSGAPALQQGNLVAVTVGGTEWEGEHVAVGMKMSCYCTWITENLPANGVSIKCCTNCCNDNAKTLKRRNRLSAPDSIHRFHDQDDEEEFASDAESPSVYRRAEILD